MLEKGLTFTAHTTVTENNTAATLGSGDMNVFATPALVALMEHAAMLCVAPTCLKAVQPWAASSTHRISSRLHWVLL